jgi:tetratricopeptide (TPR) repeat protein
MRTLKSRGGFSYIFAKLDAESLPLFAQGDLYVDFEDSPEGPRGVRFLDLLCGMKDVERNPEAVALAQQVDQDAKRAMVSVKGAIESGNVNRLVEIGTSSDPGVLSSPGPVLAVAQGLIKMGECDLARTVLARARAHFPESIRAKQFEGLALRRLGRFQEAIDVLSELKAAGHQDPETMGMLAAAWDGLYLGSQKKLHLRTARELYRTAFERDPQNYYVGLNAASKSLFLGETQEADRLAGEVLSSSALTKDLASGDDLYAVCTMAELHLLRRQLDAAAAQYQKAIDRHPTMKGDLRGTGQQARRICTALDLSPEETAKILGPFKLLDG